MSAQQWVFRLMNRVHPWLYRRAGGKGFVASVQGMPVLLLTTTGRRSGRRRTNMVGYVPEGDDLLVVGSAGGEPHHPAWALNLRAGPEAEVQVGTDRFRVRGEWTGPEERDRLWQEITNRYAFFRPYQAKAGRTIPVIRLRRVPAPIGGA
ncbi:MAG TPA: nitroreductase/quinone reductase family protein [Chloroflexota bacterium]|jgi:deazaflavin-dependent oxidoreductase (nitroreductase family)|nr:nitroreductase/quinone reductase family protein [Chloroflexota bacterium]